MQQTLFADLGTGVASSTLGGAAFTFPPLTQFDDLTLKLRLSQTINGAAVEVSRVVEGLSACLGYPDNRPTFGDFKLKVGTDAASAGVNLTTSLQYNATAEQIQSALNALSGGFTVGQKPVTVRQARGSFFIHTADGSAVTLSLGDNALFPISFGFVNQYEVDEKQVQELRLTQAPVAFTSTFSLVVPIAPTISEVQEGGENSGVKWNEVQALYVPADFRGTYYFQRGSKKSILLSTSDGPDQIASALAPLADDLGAFNVTNPLPQTAHIEFAGSMVGQGFALLEVHVGDAPDGDLTVTLPLDRNELDKLLKGSPKNEAVVPLEVVASVQDEHNSEVLHQITLLRVDVTLRMAVTKPSLATLQNINWLRKPGPANYSPFNSTQIFTGNKSYASDEICDGVLTDLPVDHNLNTLLIADVQVWETGGSGRLLIRAEDGDYTVSRTPNDANSLTIHMVDPTPPAVGSLLVIVIAAPPIASFAEGLTLEIGQVVNLQTVLDALGSRVTTLESKIGVDASTAPALTLDIAGASWKFAKFTELFGTGGALTIPDTGLGDVKLDDLPGKGAGLLPAVHSVAATTFPGGAASAATPGILYKNTGSAVKVSSGQGHKSFTLAANGYAASNGVIWYPVERYDYDQTFAGFAFTANASTDVITIASGFVPADGTRVRLVSTGTLPAGLSAGTDYYIRDTSGQTCKLSATSGGGAINITDTGSGTHNIGLAPRSTWYPSDMDRVLWKIAVTDAELRLNLMLDLQFGIEYGLLQAVSDAQWFVVVEWASFSEDTAPARTGPNLGAENWNAVPILSQRLYLTSTPAARTFGVQIRRSLQSSVDTITGSKIIMGSASGADSLPPTANFMLRARLTRFDTEDAQPSARGFVGLRGPNIGADGAASDQSGVASIKPINAG